MFVARASVEAQIIIAIGALFVVLMISALIQYWHGTSDGGSRKPPR